MSMSDISFEHVLSSQYTIFDGLAGMHVEDIYQDRRGLVCGSPLSMGASAGSTAPVSRPWALKTDCPISRL